MSHNSLISPEDLYCLPFLPDDFIDRLEYFKIESGLTWDGMANCMGVDPRQVRRWRHGTKPCGDTLFALLTLAARFPGGVHILLGVDILLPERSVLAAFAGGADFREAFGSRVASVPGGEHHKN